MTSHQHLERQAGMTCELLTLHRRTLSGVTMRVISLHTRRMEDGGQTVTCDLCQGHPNDSTLPPFQFIPKPSCPTPWAGRGVLGPRLPSPCEGWLGRPGLRNQRTYIEARLSGVRGALGVMEVHGEEEIESGAPQSNICQGVRMQGGGIGSPYRRTDG